MALINCSECNKEISDNAPACPGCGMPIVIHKASPDKFIPYSDQEVQVMLSKKLKTSHLLHLFLTVITVGFWVIMWALVAISNSTENAKIDRKITKGKKNRLYSRKAAKASTAEAMGLI